MGLDLVNDYVVDLDFALELVDGLVMDLNLNLANDWVLDLGFALNLYSDFVLVLDLILVLTLGLILGAYLFFDLGKLWITAISLLQPAERAIAASGLH